MTVGFDELNPFRSPLSVESTPEACVVSGDAGLRCDATLVRSSYLSRQVRLSGRFDAEIVWSAEGIYEYVSVHGIKVATERALWKSIPRFTFDFYSSGAKHTMVVDVWVKWFFFTRALRISIDGKAIYTEGDCSGFDLP